MDITSTDFSKSVLFNTNKFDEHSFDKIKLSEDDILNEFPGLDEEQIEQIQNDILTISEILYNHFK